MNWIAGCTPVRWSKRLSTVSLFTQNVVPMFSFHTLCLSGDMARVTSSQKTLCTGWCQRHPYIVVTPRPARCIAMCLDIWKVVVLWGGEFLVCEPLESSKTLGSICQTFWVWNTGIHTSLLASPVPKQDPDPVSVIRPCNIRIPRVISWLNEDSFGAMQKQWHSWRSGAKAESSTSWLDRSGTITCLAELWKSSVVRVSHCSSMSCKVEGT